jgi:hypothetical protein
MQAPRTRRSMIGGAVALAALMVAPAATMAQEESPAPAPAQVRVLHGAGDAPAVDVYANGDRILEEVPFGQISGYLSVPAGEYQVQVVPAGATVEEGPVVIDAPLTFESGTMTTVAATGSLASGIVPQVITDEPAPTTDGTQVRVVHLSADAPAVDIAADGGDVVVAGLAYPDATDYLSLPADEYDLEIRPAGTTDVAFDIDPLTLDAGTSYSAFAVGSLADESFTVVPAVDAQLAAVRVLHGSADAPNVDVYANGSAVLTDVPFGAVSDYLYVPAGEYRIQVVPTGATLEEGPVVIDAPLTFEGGTMTTVAATNVLAEITPKVITDAPKPKQDKAQVRVVHLSADAPEVDIAPDGSRQRDAIFEGLEFGEASRYRTVDAGTYDLVVRAAGTRARAFDIPEVDLAAGTSYSAIAIGQLGDESFQVILVEDASAE